MIIPGGGLLLPVVQQREPRSKTLPGGHGQFFGRQHWADNGDEDLTDGTENGGKAQERGTQFNRFISLH